MKIDRRHFLATMTAAPALRAQRRQPPNILFLSADQHQTRAAGCYGSHEVKTPNIDKLASAATRFDHAYCQAPVCVPARGSILTGLYPHQHGARILEDPLPDNVGTAAQFFKERGYATGAIGKMHFVDETRRHGFDYRLNERDFQATLSDEDRAALRRDQGPIESVEGKPSALPDRFFQDYWFADKTVEYIHANKTRPFCLWSSFVKPHTPMTPQARYFDLYKKENLSLPRRTDHDLENGFPGNLIRSKERGWYTQTGDELRNSLRGYYGNITQMDTCVGRVYDALRESGLADNTIVVYTADHGEMAGAHRTWTKHNMYEQSVCVPMMVSFPGRIKPNAVRSELVEHIDLFPTLAELCGFDAPRGIPGRSFARLLRGQSYTPREVAYSEYYFCRSVFTRDNRYVGKPPILMVRTDSWKLNFLSWDRCELYDLHRDPGEFENRIDDPASAGLVRELTAIAKREFSA